MDEFFDCATPSMRRPDDFSFFPIRRFCRFSRAASVTILPSALFRERFSLGGSWASSIQQVLLPEKSPLLGRLLSVPWAGLHSCGEWQIGLVTMEVSVRFAYYSML